MRLITIGLFCFAMIGLVIPVQSATVLKLTFGSPAVIDSETYEFHKADIPSDGTVSVHFNKPYINSERDYGTTQGGTPTGNFPDIVDVSSATCGTGWQGGNALYTCKGDPTDQQDHIGWYVNSDNLLSVSGDFTSEAIFALSKIGDATNGGVAGSEYSLHNVFGTEMISGPAGVAGFAGAGWKFRVWPIGIIGGTGQLQLNCAGTDGGGETNVTGPNLSIDTWYHVACVYTLATNTAELFVNGVSAGTTNPNWANAGQDDWWVGAWPSNGANRGMAGWIDAVALSDAALAPIDFVLPTSAGSSVDNWEEY